MWEAKKNKCPSASHLLESLTPLLFVLIFVLIKVHKVGPTVKETWCFCWSAGRDLCKALIKLFVELLTVFSAVDMAHITGQASADNLQPYLCLHGESQLFTW